MTYARKIDVFCANGDGTFRYVWSTNAHKTCKAAIAAANLKSPRDTFKARFA
jgi:hypothetical protein